MAVKKKPRKVKLGWDKGVTPSGEWTPKKDDRVWYQNQTWYVEKYVAGDKFIRIRNTVWPDPDEKYVTQSVPFKSVEKNDQINGLPDSGNGPELSEAEKRHRMSPDQRQKMKKIYDGAQEVIRRHKSGEASSAETVNRSKKPVREVKPKDPNLIPLKRLCAEVNVDPKIARRLLRAEKSLGRPEGRWEFYPKDADRIKKIISQPV